MSSASLSCLTFFRTTVHRKGITVSNTLHNWIFIGSNAYVEYTFIPWLGQNVYRRTVDLTAVCLQ